MLSIAKDFIKDLSDDELIARAKSLYSSIFVDSIDECFSTMDLALYNQVIDELENRGYQCQPELQVTRPEGG